MARLRPIDLRCEYLIQPLGLDVAHPRLFWRHESPFRGARQIAYRILVASTLERLLADDGDRWDSGRIEGDATAHVVYAGAPLPDLTRAWWKVMAWDDENVPTEWSVPSFWESGLSQWTSEWIGDMPLGAPQTGAPVPMLRREFHVDRPVASARLAITALGLYEPRMNGARVGDNLLCPGWTHYIKRVRYEVLDVTDRIQTGANVVGAYLGDGWYCGHVEWRGRQMYGQQPWLRAELHLTFEDGSTETIRTDEEWRAGFGEMREADILMGVAIDRRHELPGWDAPGFDASDWRSVRTTPHPDGLKLIGWRSPTVKATEEIAPIAMRAVQHGDRVFDLGQNMVGHVRLRVRGKAGATVRLRYAERVDEKGKIYTENLRSARQTDYYTLRGDAEGEVFEPRFTFHGFQYVEVRGDVEALDLGDLVGVVVHSDNPRVGHFECSDERVNQLVRNIDWGWRGNSVDLPTDCPQRDERLGWTGDAQVFVRTAASLREVPGFFAKYSQDIEDAQGPDGSVPCIAPNTTSMFAIAGGDGGPAWSDAVVICPWTIYRCYGDTGLLEKHYTSMQRFLDFLQGQAVAMIRCHPDQPGFHGFGDWLTTGNDTPKDLLGTAFYARVAWLMADIASALGKHADATYYRSLFERVRDAWQRRFLSADGLVVAQTQTAYVLALHFDLVPADVRPKVLQALVDDIGRRGGKLSTGFVGTPYLCHVLTEGGRSDVAYQLLLQDQWPSWLYAVTKGATTIWERWDGWTEDKGYQDAGMNSFNHYAYGAVGDWLVASVAGLDLDPAEPGFRRLRIKPLVDGPFESARASLVTLDGRAVSGWRKSEDGLILDVVVPPNAGALIFLPAAPEAEVRESTRPVDEVPEIEDLGRQGDRRVFRIPSGSYQFRVLPPSS